MKILENNMTGNSYSIQKKSYIEAKKEFSEILEGSDVFEPRNPEILKAPDIFEPRASQYRREVREEYDREDWKRKMELTGISAIAGVLGGSALGFVGVLAGIVTGPLPVIAGGAIIGTVAAISEYKYDPWFPENR